MPVSQRRFALLTAPFFFLCDVYAREAYSSSVLLFFAKYHPIPPIFSVPTVQHRVPYVHTWVCHNAFAILFFVLPWFRLVKGLTETIFSFLPISS